MNDATITNVVILRHELSGLAIWAINIKGLHMLVKIKQSIDTGI